MNAGWPEDDAPSGPGPRLGSPPGTPPKRPPEAPTPEPPPEAPPRPAPPEVPPPRAPPEVPPPRAPPEVPPPDAPPEAPPPELSTDDGLAELRAELLAWYRAHARDLPWRRSRDPYAIWVSEVMLQQTRVDTVIPYYERFLHRWPTVTALAAADPGEVRAAWSGLGYYRRAQAMLDAASEVAARPGATFPSDPDELRRLPGFGPYTAGAVASIAFDQPSPAVDGNVSRVLARIGGIEGDVTRGAPARAVWAMAARLAPGEAPGELNQALIELGALLCRRPPSCGACPARRRCRARIDGRTAELPPPRARPEKQEVLLTAYVLHDDRAVALSPRPEGGLFGGMWTPPVFEGHVDPSAPPPDLAALGVEPGGLTARGEVEHVLTHRRIRARVLAAPLPERLGQQMRRVALDRLDAHGLPSFAVKLLRAGLPIAQIPAELPGRTRRAQPAQPELPLGEAPR